MKALGHLFMLKMIFLSASFRRKKMGANQSLPPDHLKELLEITKFKKSDLNRWYKKFLKTTQRVGWT